MENNTERMKHLITTLNNASRAYYQEDRQIMSDYEYDSLYDELLALESSTGIILANSPTRKPGFTVLSTLEKVRHDYPMLSLDKTKETSKLLTFLGEHTGLLSWKLDGLAIALKYIDGVLVQAVTRGNGEIGEDVTHNASVFTNIPVRINTPGECVIRGEAVISFSEFKRINEKLEPEEQYKNPRNLCSGTVRQLDSKVAAGRRVSFFAYSVVSASELGDSKNEQLAWLARSGFDVVEHRIVTTDDLPDAVKEFEEKITKNDIATDGLVLTYDSISYSMSLGATSKFPRDSIAFKWADELAETTLTEIQWNTSRTGLINPVAVFEPVELMGTTVNKASLHNVSILKGLRLGIGDRITVYKANMIIPQVAENLTCSDTAEIPPVCPECGDDTELRSLREGSALYCTNPNCKAQLIRALTHFTSRDAMNIEGFSISTIEKFIEKGFIEDYTDIFLLEQHGDEIKEMEGFGEKSFNNLVTAIEKSKSAALPSFIYALGINHVGLSNAKLLCKHYDYDLSRIITAMPEELVSIEGFGEVISESVHKYFANEKNMYLLNKVMAYIRFIIPEINPEANGAQPLSGKSFVITGDLTSFVNRKALQETIETLGGKVTGSVTNKTSYLINNDTESQSSKNKKAKELSVPIINESQFLEMIGQI